MLGSTTSIGAYFTAVTDDPGPLLQRYGAAFGLSAEELVRHPHVLIGDAAALVDELERRRAAYGIAYVTVPDTAMEAFAPIVAKLAGS